MSDKDFLKKIDILYEQISELYNQISENKCKICGILIDLEFEIEKIVTKKEFIEDNNISCKEDISQIDSINEQCVDLVAELVEIIKGA